MKFEDLENYIWLTKNGIEFQHEVETEFDGDFNLLLACIEDNIVTTESGEEAINWYAVGIDYRLNVLNGI